MDARHQAVMAYRLYRAGAIDGADLDDALQRLDAGPTADDDDEGETAPTLSYRDLLMLRGVVGRRRDGDDERED